MIEVNDLFEGVDLPCVICLMVGPELAADRLTTGWVEVTAKRAELPGLAAKLETERAERTQVESTLDAAGDNRVPERVWSTVVDEVEREAEGRKRTGYDLRLAGSKLRVNLSEFAVTGLGTDHHQSLQRVRSLNGLAISWVALNQKDWRKVVEWGERGLLRIEPKLLEATSKAALVVREELCPLYEVRPQQRLGYLEDVENIVCIRDWPEKEFEVGLSYTIFTRSNIKETHEERPYTRKGGDTEIRRFTIKRRVLSIRIGKHHFDESATDVEAILEHFEVPNPGDIADRYPELVDRSRSILDELTVEHDWKEKGLAWKDLLLDSETGERLPWQREDLARIVTKGSAILGWEQGGGKSLGLLACAFAAIRYHGLPKQALFVVPQDLIPQWEREAKRFFDAEFEKIDSPAKAREVARRMKRGDEGLFITWYEALSLTGAKDERLPDKLFGKLRRVRNVETGEWSNQGVQLSTEEACPSCSTMNEKEWINRVCRACGYVHKRLKVRTIGSYLAPAFKRGVICVDELSLIRGIDSKRGKAVRGLRAKCRFAGSGTPIANYISDAFNGLSWVAGCGSLRFPYGYSDRSTFENDFAVIELMGGSPAKGEDHQTQRRKVLPQVTNVSQLWRLLAATMVRRRQEHMGDLVERTDKKVEVPLGTVQRRLNVGWLNGFAAWFESEYPDHPLVGAGMVDRFAPAIGQLAKLEAVATMPTSDPHVDYAEGRFTKGAKVSAYTPAVMKALELALLHVRKGEKVLIGSSRIDTGHFIATRLKERGVRAAHIVEPKGGDDTRFATKSPKKRATEVKDFCDGDGQVLCVGIEAMKLGHDLAAASVAIVIGLPWSHESDAQFVRRIHRLSSQKPVTVYRVIPVASLAERKFSLLSDKSAASDLALDGQLVDDPPEPVNWEKQIKQMRAAGLAVSEDDTLDEAELEALWKAAEGVYEPVIPALPAARPKVLATVGGGGSEKPEPKAFVPFTLTDLVEQDNGQLGLDF